MSKKEKLQKHTLYLRQGDMEILKTHFPAYGGSVVIRKLVAEFIDTKINTQLTPQELESLDD